MGTCFWSNQVSDTNQGLWAESLKFRDTPIAAAHPFLDVP
jgi:hypothetical protein